MPAAASPVAPASTLTLSVFVALSSGLTGVSAARLKPALDPIDIASRYHAAVVAGVPAAILDRIVAVFLAAPTAAEGAAAILADPALGPVGQSIIKLWQLGSWYSPSAPAAAVNIVSAQAYRGSLVWRAMQSRSMDSPLGPFTTASSAS